MTSKQQSSTMINNIYKSRKIILDLCQRRKYDIKDYDDFSINDIQTLFSNKQLDMILQDKDKKLFIKYNIYSKLRPTHLYDIVDEFFNIENILEKKDELIIIIKENVNDTLKNIVETIYKNQGIFVNIFTLNRLLFNVLDHELQPPTRKLSLEEKNKCKEKYNITNDSQFPEISRFDPLAMAIGLRPGEVCEIDRKTPTAINSKFYRLCI